MSIYERVCMACLRRKTSVYTTANANLSRAREAAREKK